MVLNHTVYYTTWLLYYHSEKFLRLLQPDLFSHSFGSGNNVDLTTWVASERFYQNLFKYCFGIQYNRHRPDDQNMNFMLISPSYLSLRDRLYSHSPSAARIVTFVRFTLFLDQRDVERRRAGWSGRIFFSD